MSIQSKIICDGCGVEGPLPQSLSMIFNGYRHLWRAYNARYRLSLLGWVHRKGATDYCPGCVEAAP